MKKKLLAAGLTVVLLAGLMACANNTEDFESEKYVELGEYSGAEEDLKKPQVIQEQIDDIKYMKDFEPAKYVELGEYSGVEVDLKKPQVTQEQIDAYMDRMLSYYPTVIEVTDRSDVQEGDTVNLDYEGKKDGVAFEGGTAQGASLTIGSGQFIEGFEDGMIGMEVGETKDLELTFPDPYLMNPDMSGAQVVFTVTVNSITVQEPAILDDAFVAGRGIEGVSTVEEYETYVHDLLDKQQMEQFRQQGMETVIDAVQDQVTFQEVPAGMINRMNEVLVSNVEAYSAMFGMEVGEYVAAVYECSADNYQEELKNQAELMAQRYVMLAAIAEKEGLVVTEEELQEALEKEAPTYGYTDIEAYKEAIDVEAYREYLIYKKAGEFLLDHAVLTGEEAQQ